MVSANNLDYLESLGADEVIDYKTQKFEDIVHDVDIVLEASPIRDNKERIKSVRVLKDGGILVTVNTDFPFDDELMKVLAAKGVKGELAPNQPRHEWLQKIAVLIDEGNVSVLVSNIFPLEEIAEAHRKSESWNVRGKLVLEIRKKGEPA